MPSGGRRRRWWRAGGAGVVVAAAVALVVALSGGTGGQRSGAAGPPPGPTSTARPPSTTVPSTTASSTTAPATTATPPQPALPAPSGQQFGASVNRLFNDAVWTPAQIDAQLTGLRAAGATVARADALWEATEPSAPQGGVHRYRWGFDDRIAQALATHGLSWLPILDYSAPWAQSVPGQDHSPPRAAADYAAYARAFASRYGSGGSFWRSHPALAAAPVTTYEIWNEPDNGGFWSPSPDAAGYAALYLAARGAIDAAQPTARVIVGGLTRPVAFIPAILAAAPQLAGHVDGVAIHPYGTPAVVVSRIRAARATLTALGMAGVPLYVTEFGWTTDPPGAVDYLPASRRPADIRSTLAALGHLACGVAASVLYTWVTPQRSPADTGDWYGISAPDGAATPSTRAFAAGVRAARGPGPAAPCGE